MNAFLQHVIFSPDDIWNGDGKSTERLEALKEAVEHLPFATTEEEARKMYWRIDNVAVIQDSLFPAGAKILPALVQGLFQANDVSRAWMLQAIYAVANGTVPEKASVLTEWQSVHLPLTPIVEGAIRYFFHLALHGSETEAFEAIELIALVIFQKTNTFPLPPGYPYEIEVQLLLDALRDVHPRRYENLYRDLHG